MLSTDRQTDRQTNQRYQKHNLLCQGGKKEAPHETHLYGAYCLTFYKSTFVQYILTAQIQ